MKKKLLKSVLATMAGVSIVGVGTGAFAFTTTFNGEMAHGILGTTDYDTLKGTIQSNKTDYFSYGGKNKSITDLKSLEVFNNGGKGDVMGLSRIRFGVVGTTDDGLAKFVYTMEVGAGTWGDSTASTGKNASFGLSGDGVNVETRFLYTDLAIPGLGKDHRIVAGLQPINVNPWLWKETAAGLTYNGKMDVHSWQIGWVKGRTGSDPFNDTTDDDYFLAKFDTKLMKGVKAGVFGVYSDQGSKSPYVGKDLYNGEIYYLGATGSADLGQFFVNGDVIYQGGSINFITNGIEDLDREAWLLHLDAGMKPMDNLKVWLSGLYVTGDDNAGDGEAENFDIIDSDIEAGMIFFKEGFFAGSGDMFLSDAPYILDKGLKTIALYGEYKADQQNTIKGSIRYLMLDKDYQRGWDATKNRYKYSDDKLGTELDVWYNYAYNKNVDLKFEAGYLFAGKAADYMVPASQLGKHGADDIFQAGAGILFKF